MSIITATANVDLCITAQRELFGAGRMELADALIGADCLDHGGESGPRIGGRDAGAARGPEGIRGVVAWLRSAFADLAWRSFAVQRSTCSASAMGRSPSTGPPATTSG